MKVEVRHRVGARRDVIEAYRRYAREAGLRVADRFLASAEAVFERLAGMPLMGARFDHDHPALAVLRYLPLTSRFEKFLVFYRPVPGGIEIVRVLHGARDIPGILSGEFATGEDEGGDEAAEDEGV